jgi:hypothetical protein
MVNQRRRGWLVRAALVALLGCAALVGLVGPARALPTRTLGKEPGVRVPIPEGFDAEGKRTNGRLETLTLTDGTDALVVTVYRATDTWRAPTATAALRAHAEELGKTLGADEHLASARVAGRDVPARSFEFKRSGAGWRAVVVALDAGDTIGRLTIVAVWVAVAGGPGERELASAVADIETK